MCCIPTNLSCCNYDYYFGDFNYSVALWFNYLQHLSQLCKGMIIPGL